MSPEAGGGLPRLRPVPLQELRLRAEALVWTVEQKLVDLDSLTPVRGQVQARHHGSVLEVEGEVETIVTLCCDRCLQHFNRPLQVAVHELLELAGSDAEELEGSDLTALAASAAAASTSRRRSREPGPGSGTSGGSSAPGRRPGGRPPAADRDRGRRDAAVPSDRSPLQPSAASNASSPDSQPRRGSRARTQSEPLLIEVLDDRLDPRGDFDPERWLFEQLSLQLPVVNRCGSECPGPPQARGDASTVAADSQHRNPAPPAAEAPPSGSVQAPELKAASFSHLASQSVSQQLTEATEAAAAGSASPPAAAGPPNAPAAAAPIDPRWAALRQLLP